MRALLSPPDPSGGTTIDVEARATLTTLMALLRQTGVLGQVVDPGLVPGLVLDINLEHISTTPADNDPVGFVPDQYGKTLQLLQAVGAQQPTYKAAIANGRGVLRFAANQWLDSGAFVAEIPQPFTILTVATAVGTGTPPSILDSTNASRFQLRAQGLINAGSDCAPTVGTLPSGLAVFSGVFDGSNSVTRVGSSARYGVGNVGANAMKQLRLGANSTPNGTNGFAGDWCRTLVYNRRLRDGEILMLSLLLGATYGATA